MTTYKEIFGKQVKNYSSDPANNAEGQVWYNSTSGTFKSLLSLGAWSSGGSMVLARRALGGAGTQTAGLVFGGASPSATGATEEYNGSGWSTGGALNTVRSLVVGLGIQTAALAVGGYSGGLKNETEEYNGSSWSEQNNISTNRYAMGAAGIQTAGVVFGGQTPGNTGVTEEYDGTNWTTNPGSMNTGRGYLGGCGTQTAALAFGGSSDPDATEEYNGSAWTTVNNMVTGRTKLAGCGTQTAALGFGGFPATAATEQYDGTSWTTISSLGTARGNLAGAGTQPAGLAFGGGPPDTGATEEYNFSTTVTTAAAWASGGNMNTARRIGGGSSGGNINSSLMFGGDTLPMGAGNPQVKVTEEYNGSAWTNGGNVGNNVSGSAGAGTESAMIGATGYSTSGWTTAGASYIANAFEYNGTSWSDVTAYPTTGVGLISLGTQTASLFGGGAQGGSPGPEANQKSKLYKEYDGTNWTTGGTSNTFHSRGQSGAGTQTAGIVYGGYDAPGGNPSGRSNKLESYNGTAWTSELTGPIETAIGQAFGTESAYVYSGGQNAPIPSSPGTVGYSFTTLVYDGTTMSTSVNTATRRVIGGGDGSSGASTGMVCGGSSAYSTLSNATEEYSVETTALNTKTLTTS